MTREIRTVAVCEASPERSEDYLDYRDVPRQMTVLVSVSKLTDTYQLFDASQLLP